MKIEQIYTSCLAQGTYYITSKGEATIIDPLRETQPYLDRLKRDNVTLKYIFETHFHADFVSGHIDLSQATGAPIVFGPNASCLFDATIAKDQQEFMLGDITIKVLHTPGHTMESSCFLLLDENKKEHALFSGDTLFIGDVGRPDLAQKDTTMTEKQLATLLFRSLRTKIMILPDDIIIYPAHGAGSACGKNMSKETWATLGEQKQHNYALRANMTETEFIKEVIDGLLPPPSYFGMNVTMNKQGYDSFTNVLHKGLKALSVDDFEATVQKSKALVLDTRSNNSFYKGYIPQAINIGIQGDFAPWVGTIIGNVNQPLLVVTDMGKEEETITRLARVGFDHVLGYLQGGFEAWTKAGRPIATINRISATTFESKVALDQDMIIDVRKETEYESEHIKNAINKPLASIADWMNTLNPEKHFYLHCAGGYRSMIAASLLQARGYHHLTEIEGGFQAIAKTTIPKTHFICQNNTLK